MTQYALPLSSVTVSIFSIYAKEEDYETENSLIFCLSLLILCYAVCIFWYQYYHWCDNDTKYAMQFFDANY